MSSVCSHEWGVSCLNIVMLFSFNFFDKLSAVMETGGGERDSRSHFCTCCFFFKKQMARAKKKSIKPATSKFSSKRSYVFSLFSFFFFFCNFNVFFFFVCSIFKSLHPLSQTHKHKRARARIITTSGPNGRPRPPADVMSVL